MNPQRRHDVNLNVAVEQHVESVESPAKRGGDQRTLLRRSDLREGGSGGGHWVGGLYQLSSLSRAKPLLKSRASREIHIATAEQPYSIHEGSFKVVWTPR